MSLLDQHFAALESRGLTVQQQDVPGESTLEPGFLYRVEGANQSAIFGIASHRLSDVVGQRLALKIVAPAETPPGGALSITAPEGQLIEGDDGEFREHVSIGRQALGSYREWLCDPDGYWLMVSRVPTTPGDVVPTGQIVIKGVPVTIKGVALVNTPPVVPPAPPVTVASPVKIVPRAARIAPRPAPIVVPRSVTTIELEDAFADASLEMDATGDRFRVADELQAAVDLALDAIRYPVTLRTDTVSGTSFEEIGVVRVDATPHGGAMTLIAELETSGPTQVAELQLYNRAAGVVVTTVSTSSTVTAKVTADVTLPLAEVLYSVRLRRVGGDASQRVSCRSVVLQVR